METVVEVLNPITTFGNNDSVELPQNKLVCVISCSFRTDFTKTNPQYTSPIFLSYYPEFSAIINDNDNSKSQYTDLWQTYYNMANHCLDYRRFGYDWYYLMSAFIAHYMALALQKLYAISTNSSCSNNIQLIGAIANQNIGLAVKESLGGEEVQTEQMINVGLFKNAGEYMLTPYGREFWDKYISYAKNFFRGVY